MDEGDGTRCVHGGHAVHGSVGDPLHPGPVLSTAFHLDPAEPPGLYYGRAGNPTWTALEAAIGALDGGECVTFASGMAAITAVLRLCARPGRAIVLPSDGYYAERLRGHAPRGGPAAARREGRGAEGRSVIQARIRWRTHPRPWHVRSTTEGLPGTPYGGSCRAWSGAGVVHHLTGRRRAPVRT